MKVELSANTANVMLGAMSKLMDGGSIRLMSSDRSLAVLQLSSPAAAISVNGELEFNKIAEEDAALAQGNATRAQVVAADGSVVFECDVGDENSDAVIKLNTTRIYRGGPVRLKSFRLVMPS